MGAGLPIPLAAFFSPEFQALGLFFALFFGLALLVCLTFWVLKKKPGLHRTSDPLALSLKELNMVASTPPASSLPQAMEGLETHRLVVALENGGRTEAIRFAKERPLVSWPSPPRIWIYAGPDLLGAMAMAMARHLDALGFPVTVQLGDFWDRLGEPARRQAAILEKAHIRRMDSPLPAPLPGVCALILGADPSQLSPSPLKDRGLAIAQAEALGIPCFELGPFSPSFVPPVPGPNEIVIPVPPTVLSREETRLWDSLAQSHYGIPGAALMENAGYGAAREAWLWTASSQAEPGAPSEVVVLCGRGNNGGDGLVLARLLRQWGLAPAVFFLGQKEKTTPEAWNNLKLLEETGVQVMPLTGQDLEASLSPYLRKGVLIADGLFGTGLTGRVRPEAAELIARVEKARLAGCPVLALDIPSGLDANTGEILGSAVRADRTVTFAAPKTGFFKGQGPAYCGRVIVADIGLPREIYVKRRQKTAEPLGE